MSRYEYIEITGIPPPDGHVLVDVRPAVAPVPGQLAALLPLAAAARTLLGGGGAARLLPEQLLRHALVINLETDFWVNNIFTTHTQLNEDTIFLEHSTFVTAKQRPRQM